VRVEFTHLAACCAPFVLIHLTQFAHRAFGGPVVRQRDENPRFINTVPLPPDLKQKLSQYAQAEDRSEASVIRTALLAFFAQQAA
jgi:hypothetical protein